MEKYGFVYIWFDRYRKMYYIGSHWGTIDDGYVCSSNRMRDAYRRRPDDFKRKILENKFETRQLLLEAEYKWLQKISDDDLGKKYYNMTKHLNGHWSADKQKFLTAKEKMSINHRSKRGMSNKGVKYKRQKESALTKLKGNERTEAQKAATIKLSKTLTGKKRKPYPKEHGRKISESRKNKPTGIVPKSAFQKGRIPWNKGLKMKENLLNDNHKII